MAAEEALAQDNAKPVGLSEDQQRKRALDIVKKAVRNSAIPLGNRSVTHRLLPGLWAATVNILLACLDVKDVMKLLSNRMALLAHEADNDAATPVNLTGAHLNRYVKEVGIAAQAIAEVIGQCIPQLEKEGIDDRLPETVLDCAIFLLVNSWGPVHLRRAMVEQVAAFLSEKAAPSVFMEPSEHIRRKHDSDVHQETETPAQPHEPVYVMPDRSEKSIRIFADYRLQKDGAEWAVAIQKSGPGNVSELHVMKGEAADFNGRSAPLAAIVEALKSVSYENKRSHIAIETTHDFVVKGMEGIADEHRAFRHNEEDAIWKQYDSLVEGRDIKAKAVSANLSDHLQNVCDMVMKRGPLNLV